MITLRRVYDPEKPGEHYRVLVDRLWPRGISKDNVTWDEWMKEVGPSNQLRKWFGHDPSRWEKFKSMYREELGSRQDLLKKLRQLEEKHGTLTLLYSSREHEYNNAVALRELLMQT
ncbi:MAG TPA: DUF488 family protein [Bacteroidales bacterium]|jgi:uncharacterized protein YeaO (DUF488 family)|nr:DUF488 family protein [Bacteroidales bacterium]HNR42773.1 DUF488 family protein [Bacteroidales bacterium]HPM19498.1 DUF488 family protein [Bacteroidales bacterium]HQG76157.1 DUF488 family protein [Bacteroidales bacterium]